MILALSPCSSIFSEKNSTFRKHQEAYECKYSGPEITMKKSETWFRFFIRYIYNLLILGGVIFSSYLIGKYTFERVISVDSHLRSVFKDKVVGSYTYNSNFWSPFNVKSQAQMSVDWGDLRLRKISQLSFQTSNLVFFSELCIIRGGA